MTFLSDDDMLKKDSMNEKTEEEMDKDTISPDGSPPTLEPEQPGEERDSKQELTPEQEQQLLIEALEKRGRRRFINGMLFGAFLAVFGMFAAAFGPGMIRSLLGQGNPGAEVLTDTGTIAKLAEIREIIEEYYLDEVDARTLEASLFKGVAAGLEDAYANYYTAEELSSVMDSTRGEYYGIGATIGTDPDTGEFYVGEVYEDGPADEGGLLVNDIVRAVDGEYTENLSLTELVSLIRSKETFTMTVYRPDTGEELELTITCGDVTPVYVNYEMLENHIGYLQLTEFTESAVEQFREAVEALNGQGMEKLIVDLRDNPGGLLTSVCDILDEILPEGLIVYTEDKNGNREEYMADDERSVTCEVAVLVNGNSASASEIFAGAIQDYGLGPIIGTQTYGKGVVQKTYSLSDGSAFKLTVENYYTPNGQEIDGNGITPDIAVEEEGETDNAAETSNGTDGEYVADSEPDDPVLARALQELSD